MLVCLNSFLIGSLGLVVRTSLSAGSFNTEYFYMRKIYLVKVDDISCAVSVEILQSL